MSTIKSATITGAAVLAVASAPFIWQHSKTGQLNRDIAALESERVALADRSGEVRSAGATGTDLGNHLGAEPARTVQDLLAATDKPIDVDELMRSMMDVMMTQDIVGMIQVLLPLTNLSSDDYTKLIDEIEAYKGQGQMKQMALQMMASFAPTDNPRESIERMMKIGVEPYAYSNLLAQWGASDPDGALAWYREKEATGELAGKGVNSYYEGMLIAELVGGIASKDPAQAIQLFKENRDVRVTSQMVSSLGRSFGNLIRKGGDDDPLREVLEEFENSEEPGHARNLVIGAMRTAVGNGDFDAGLAFASQYLEKAEDRMEAAVSMLSGRSATPLKERGDWLMENTPSDLQAEAAGQLVRSVAWQKPEDASGWIESQSGAVRDSGLKSLAFVHTSRGNNQAAYDQAQKIKDETLRGEALESVARNWVQRDLEAARKSLPEELVEKYKPELSTVPSEDVQFIEATVEP